MYQLSYTGIYPCEVTCSDGWPNVLATIERLVMGRMESKISRGRAPTQWIDSICKATSTNTERFCPKGARTFKLTRTFKILLSLSPRLYAPICHLVFHQCCKNRGYFCKKKS